MILTQQHLELKRTIDRFVENEINPHVEEWEQSGCFPAKELFKKWAILVFWASASRLKTVEWDWITVMK
ncbi:acyl-CoA dehydrogenase [Endozoicomonas montiporae CL-33]|uniref:Acyl-CoA dehydrogenase n=1 Tax=Endozoicomonas montiporae CL-33 TaxID=570277 RepID=A0A142BGP9_9GAMM|nr:acyl-CoA dehydrogenase [Endozoicomonas montiporae CL-33]